MNYETTRYKIFDLENINEKKNVLDPYKISLINYKNIMFKKKPKIIKDKKIIFLKYHDDMINNFVVQISKLSNHNIINSNEIEFEVKDEKIINFFEGLDNYIIDTAKLNPVWFNNIDSINYIRVIRNNNFLKLKLVNNEDLQTKLYCDGNELNNFDELENLELTGKIILEIYAVYIKSDSFGLILRPINISLESKSEYNYRFIEESESSDIVDSDDESLIDNIVDDNIFMKEKDESTTSSVDLVNNIDLILN
jgi:hypothetical protein